MKKNLVIALSIILLTAAVFAPVAGFQFLRWDDEGYVSHNEMVARGLTLEGVRWAFGFQASNWHPLTWVSHMVDVSLFDLRPGAHHLMGLGLHITAAVLFFLVLAAMTGSRALSAAVALLFAIHPLHVESVAWIAERKDVLSALCLALALGAWLSWLRRPGWRRYLVVLALYLVGLAAKPMLVSLPLLLLILDWWPLGRLGGGRPLPMRQMLFEKLPLALLAAGSSVLTVLAQRTGGTMNVVLPLGWLPLGDRLANAVTQTTVYLGQALWPSGLIFFYPHPRGGIPAWESITAALFLGGFSVALFLLARRLPGLLTGWLWYLGMLAPVVGLVQVGLQARADRYTYLPLIGIFLAAGIGLAALARGLSLPRWVLPAATLVIVAAFAVVARAQVEHWRDDRTLYARAIAVNPDNWMARKLMADLLTAEGRNDEAAVHFTEFRRLAPTVPHGQGGSPNDLVTVADGLFNAGNYAHAEARYRQALSRAADNAAAQVGLGNALFMQGKWGEALDQYRAALRVDARNAGIHYNMGIIFMRLGQHGPAADSFGRALEINPAFAAAHNNLGIALESLGRRSEAAVHYREALRLDPSDELARSNLIRVQ